MTEEKRSQSIRQIEAGIRALASECRLLDERRHILLPLLKDAAIQQALRAKLDSTPGAYAWNRLVPLLGLDLLRDHARLFLDTNAKTGSLMSLWRKFSADPEVKRHFRDAYGRMLDGLYVGGVGNLPADLSAKVMSDFKEKDRNRNFADFDSRLLRLEADMATLAQDAVVGKVREFRNRYVAHMDVRELNGEFRLYDPAILGLTYDALFDFGGRCFAAVGVLMQLLTGENWELEVSANTHTERGRALWVTLSQ